MIKGPTWALQSFRTPPDGVGVRRTTRMKLGIWPNNGDLPKTRFAQAKFGFRDLGCSRILILQIPWSMKSLVNPVLGHQTLAARKLRKFRLARRRRGGLLADDLRACWVLGVLINEPVVLVVTPKLAGWEIFGISLVALWDSSVFVPKSYSWSVFLLHKLDWQKDAESKITMTSGGNCEWWGV